MIQKDIDQTQKLIDELSERIRNLLAPYDNAVERLKEIPGLSTKVVEDLIAEIGLDMEVFPTEKNLASWAGMSPGNNESAGKKKLSHQSHGNKQVKSIMTEAAWAATRTKDTFYNARYHKVAARRGKKRALIAVGHSILTSVWHVLHDNVSYNELGAEYLTKRIALKRK